MEILELITQDSAWQAYLAHKISQGNLCKKDLEALQAFIDTRAYLPLAEQILNGAALSPPEKSLISKAKAGRKRTVYTFPATENRILKLITFLLRKYDGIFAPNLYSFRSGRGVKQATRDILAIPGLRDQFVYKADIHDYFNSVDIALLLPRLKIILAEEPKLYAFLEALLRAPWVSFEGQLISERKGIMAGTPISTFLANVYLMELDQYFYRNRIPYMRYSDDILVFAPTRQILDGHIQRIRDTLAEKHLALNPDKEAVFPPHACWDFLGFSYQDGVIDISRVSFEKLKGKMRRKTRALRRWADSKGVSGDRAARTFIKRFNAKLYDNPVYSELTWTRWFFPVINTDQTLKQIDAYMCQCVRYLVTGTHSKQRYACRYETIKALGFRSLVNEYYRQQTNSDP